MSTPVPKLIRRPSRSIPSILLALVLLALGGLVVWLAVHRMVNGAWPESMVGTLTAIGSTTLGSVTAIIFAIILAVCGLAMIIGAVWPGVPDRVEIFPDDIPGQTVAKRRDLANLIQTQIEQLDGVHSAIVTANGSRVDVIVYSVLDDLGPVREAARKKTNEVLKMLAPVGIVRTRVRIKHIS